MMMEILWNIGHRFLVNKIDYSKQLNYRMRSIFSTLKWNTFVCRCKKSHKKVN